MNNIKEKLISMAMEMGADDATIFTIDQVAFDERTIMKCLYGCSGGMPYCPTRNDASNIKLLTEATKKYKWGIIIETHDLRLGQKITLELEKKAFLSGYTFAFGGTECQLCSNCKFGETDHCLNPTKIRPPLYAFGIDVYKTVRNIGWTLEVVQNRGDLAKNITAVFVE